MTTSTTRSQAEATQVATELLTRLQTAWNAADGQAFGACYLLDATFVNVRGEHIVGRGAIADGHQGIFDTIYRGSTNTMRVVAAEAVADGVILAVSRHTLVCPTGPLAGRHEATSTSVVVRDGAGEWAFRSSHNTLVAV